MEKIASCCYTLLHLAADRVGRVWHAAGIRVRKFPITLDRLIESQ
jgi:hypothetical protein